MIVACRGSRKIARGSTRVSWFETHGFTVLLTMRVASRPHPAEPRSGVSKDESPPLSVALEIQPLQHGVR